LVRIFFEVVRLKVGCRHRKTVRPNGDSHRAVLECTTYFSAQDYVPCHFPPPPTPMAHYQPVSRDEHELSSSLVPSRTETLNDPNDPSNDPSNDPWNDELTHTVSARPQRGFFLPFHNVKSHIFFLLGNPQYQNVQPLQSRPPNKFPTRAMSRRVAQQKRKKRMIWIVVGALVIVVAAVAVGVAVSLTKKKGSGSASSSSGSSGGGSGSGSSSGSSSSTSGKTGSRVTMEDGSTFVYTNDFGGDWAMDPKLPFAAGGQAQSWTPRVGKDDWVWGKDVVKGVNLG